MATEAEKKLRRKAFRRGHRAELVAALYLIVRRYRILAIRYRTKVGEIDIIARKGDLVACIEVKARASEEGAVFAVTGTAQHRIRAASDVWLARQPDAHRLSIRYDIVAVLPWRLPRHLPDAF
ncbi:YraN family protein [Rhizobium sp. TRM96647]|uniref:YraN family protein n=1 Tax=unclassified Rhizobium TaxID=2613769 RepID=UPI0021E748B0|nr:MULTISPECIES: YraN family protein [unclassified Rhizobium]MCV3736536.1 YraN family protein [Rhizobium sp. TRM96647]MCV3758905.1 YraN family protein [Rhizobium sp. TRM96650]